MATLDKCLRSFV